MSSRVYTDHVAKLAALRAKRTRPFDEDEVKAAIFEAPFSGVVDTLCGNAVDGNHLVGGSVEKNGRQGSVTYARCRYARDRHGDHHHPAPTCAGMRFAISKNVERTRLGETFATFVDDRDRHTVRQTCAFRF